jgi:tRNA-2-methylthio-N6-dimethylallyladenosine synthase
MNSYDSDRILESVQHSHSAVSRADQADVIVFNTCHIRERAAEKIYSEVGMLKELKKNNKNLKLIITGCVAQAEGQAMIRRQPMIDAIIGPQMYHEFSKLLYEIKDKRVIKLDFENDKKFKKLKEKRILSNISSFVTIQEGCDKFCSFCVVPFTRGAESSRRVQDIYDEVSNLVQKGCKEIILLGQNVNAYHGLDKDNKEVNIAKLIIELEGIPELQRITYTTSHPRDMNDELINLHNNSIKLNSYLHLPVQSGSNAILKAMNRGYTSKDYLNIVNRVRKKCPDIALSSDFIVGFPGESRSDFKKTIELVKEVSFAQAYSFKYSSRPGTKSSRIKIDDISIEESNDRLHEIQEILNKQQRVFNSKFLSKKVEVLVKGKGKKKDQYRGTTKWMQVVNFISQNPVNSFEKVNLKKISNNSISGEV